MSGSLIQSSEISSYLLKANETKARKKNQSKSGFATTVRNDNTESEEEILKDWKGAPVELFFVRKRKRKFRLS